jgi:hypothetical protein
MTKSRNTSRSAEITLKEFLKGDPKDIAATIIAGVSKAKVRDIVTAMTTERVYVKVIREPVEEMKTVYVKVIEGDAS